jgi:hypothetical protein
MSNKEPLKEPTSDQLFEYVLPFVKAAETPGAPPGVNVARDAMASVLSLPGESRRKQLLNLLEKAKPGQKINTLAEGLSKEEMNELMERTREAYRNMPVIKSVFGRLSGAIKKHFEADEAQELIDLADHSLGLYLNTDQYHNAVHALSMTRETLHLAEIAGITDKETLRALVIQGLYHDAGNGIHPVPADTKQADEAQAVGIFMRDVREGQRRVRDREDPGSLASLVKLRGVKMNGETVDQRELIAACIAATVFRDRFAPAHSLAFNEYMKAILEHVHGTDPRFLQIRHLDDFLTLMDSGPAWIARNADVAGSTYVSSVLYNNLLNREEDVRRGMASGVGFAKYHNGFIGFIGATFHQGAQNDAVKTAKGGSPLYYPGGGASAEAIAAYGKQQLVTEKARFEKLISEHEPMLNALFVLMGEEISKGKDAGFLKLPLKEIRARLAAFAADPKRIQRANAILTQDPVTSLDLDLSEYPLLGDKRYADKKIPELTPGIVNRIFAPNEALSPDEESTLNKLQTLEQSNTDDPLLPALAEIADLYPEKITIEHIVMNRGQPFIEAGAHPDRVIVVLEGAVSVHLPDKCLTLGPGTLLGEISVLTGKPATADVFAMSNVNALSLGKDLVTNEYSTEDLKQRMTKLMEERLERQKNMLKEADIAASAKA